MGRGGRSRRQRRRRLVHLPARRLHRPRGGPHPGRRRRRLPPLAAADLQELAGRLPGAPRPPARRGCRRLGAHALVAFPHLGELRQDLIDAGAWPPAYPDDQRADTALTLLAFWNDPRDGERLASWARKHPVYELSPERVQSPELEGFCQAWATVYFAHDEHLRGGGPPTSAGSRWSTPAGRTPCSSSRSATPTGATTSTWWRRARARAGPGPCARWCRT